MVLLNTKITGRFLDIFKIFFIIQKLDITISENFIMARKKDENFVFLCKNLL